MALKTSIGLLTLGFTATLFAQSINVDVGPPGSGPSSSYGAAGDTGFWNTVTGAHISPFTPGPTPNDDMLLDVGAKETGVGFHQFGGMDPQQIGSSDATGSHADLMNDYLVTHSASLESCMYLNGLENGLYEVITYAWFPNQDTTMQKVRFDGVPGETIVGGAWPGGQQDGVTYSYDLIDVSGGHIGWHVGIPSGGSTVIGSAFNGFQLHKVGPPGDGDDDGDVDLTDYKRLDRCLGGPNVSPGIAGCLEPDIDDDGDIDLADMAEFQIIFTGS